MEPRPRQPLAAATREDLRRRLSDGWHEQHLRRNYENLLERAAPDGFFPESLTGAYDGMFPRTAGALARLFTLTGELGRLESTVRYVLESMMHASLERVPHIIGPRGADGRIPLIDDVDQIDGQASVILAWALLALARGPGTFEDETFPALVLLMDRSSDAPYLGRWIQWRIDPGLVLNTHFEHSREWNYWFGYDLLSQSFMMAALTRNRGDGQSAGSACPMRSTRA